MSEAGQDQHCMSVVSLPGLTADGAAPVRIGGMTPGGVYRQFALDFRAGDDAGHLRNPGQALARSRKWR